MVQIEICLDSVGGMKAAEDGGADRVELCAALEVGGVTPSLATLEAARRRGTLPVMVMVRPRAGDFCYSPDEVYVMAGDVEWAAGSGAAGVVFGALQPDGSVDRKVLARLVEKAGSLESTASFIRSGTEPARRTAPW